MSFIKKKNNEKKDIFEFNHIDKNLSPEKNKIKLIILEKRKLT